MMRALFCTLALALLAGCASSSAEAPPASAGQVDLQRYQGTWYELARLPMYFQRNCAQSEARYSLLPDGDMSVFNRCLTTEWKWEEAKGTANVEKDKIVASAQAEIEQEVERAKQQLRERVAELAVAGAEKILRKEINASAHADMLVALKQDL